MSVIDDIAAGLASVAGLGRDAVGPAASAPPVVQRWPGGRPATLPALRGHEVTEPSHRPVPPPLVGAMLAAVEHATDQAGATAESHADAREGG